MQRRNFIRLAGGGIVAAAGATGAAAFTLRSAYPDAAIEAWQGPAPADDPRQRPGADPRRWALAYAITAPNPHNLQPWLVDLRESGVITLRTDRQRVLPQTDPFGRQILIGHGAFLELLVLALAEQGLASEVTLWPQGELPPDLRAWDERPVARVRVSPAAAGARPDPLFAQVLRRHTPKSDFDTARPVSGATLQTLLAAHAAGASTTAGAPATAGSSTTSGLSATSAAPVSVVQATGTVEAARLPALRALCWESAQAELLTPATVMESVRLFRVGPHEILRHRDGISINGAMPRVLDALGLFDRSQPPAEGSSAYKQMMGRFRGHSDTAMGFAWLATPGNSRSQQIEAGRAYVRLQLKATELGLGMHPMSQALQEFKEMAPHYERAHQLMLGRPAPRGANEPTVQMFVRLGYTAQPAPATPRRPLMAFVA